MDDETFEGGYAQQRDWVVFMDAVIDAPYAPPCQNFPDAYYSNEPGDQTLAISGCAICPVVNKCAEYAIKWETQGVWGGLSARKRQELRSRVA